MDTARSRGGRAEEPFFGWITSLVHQHRAQLVSVARAEGLGPEDALDCAQEAFQSFLVVPQARLLVEDSEDSLKLLTVLARNIARNQRRRHHRSQPHDEQGLSLLRDETETPDIIVTRAETYIAAVGCMATLGELQRAVVQLRLIDEIPGEDVAATLAISSSNVAVMLHRAKSKLRACIPD